MPKTKEAATATSLPLDQQQRSSSALASPSGEEAALALALDGVPIEDDGLTEVGAEDIKLSAKVWNFKGTDDAGDPIQANVFYDTVTEVTERALDLMLIKLHKTNEWREYDEAEGKSRVRCRSFDQLKGTMDNGTVRPCKDCPDARWESIAGKDGKSKRTRRCGPVYNVFAAEFSTRQPCVLRFKRTSLPVIQTYLNKHHIGRRVEGSKRTNWPLFVYRCRASLKMSDDKKYAIPVLERGEQLTREWIELGAQTVPYVNNVLLGELGKVIDADGSDEGAAAAGGGDTSFEPDKYADDAGKDFVDGSAA